LGTIGDIELLGVDVVLSGVFGLGYAIGFGKKGDGEAELR
jgi:hypothetical protein